MSNKRTIILRGSPEINEYGKAGETIKPGYLVKGVSTVLKQTVNGTKVAVALALERSEFGTGIDNAHQGQSTVSAYYASGDQVKVGVFDAGDEAVVFVASGETISEDTLLGADNTNPGLFKSSPTVPLCRSLETLGAVTVETAVKVQVI
jgi:hypothetical protein